jgi:peptidoglycan/LPS O-acetylase OafA/YrhL
MLRSAAAVLTGYLLFAVAVLAFFTLSGHEPHASASVLFMVLSTVFGILFSVLGGYVSALIAGKFEIEHSFAVATLIAAIGAASLIAESPMESKWTQLSAILIIAPAAILGGYFRRRQVRTKILDLRRSRHQ